MIIALKSEHHGTHIAYSETEAQECEKIGWRRDRELSQVLSGVPQEEIKRKPGRPPKVE